MNSQPTASAVKESKLKCKFRIRYGERRDCGAIAGLIKELAVYEKMPDQAKLTARDLERDAFDSNPPYFHCIVAEAEVESESPSATVVVGFALYFYSYSTWEGKMIYLEDYYVSPNYRGMGLGTKLLRFLAKIATEGGFCRLKLECLDWNKPSIEFYQKQGGVDTTEREGWHSFRFTKEVLAKLAAATDEDGPSPSQIL